MARECANSLRLALEFLLRLKQFLLRSSPGEQDRVRGLERGGMEQLLLAFVTLHHPSPIASEASAVPSTRALIFAKAVSRLVEVSSLKGEKPQSSVVPSCSSGM